MMLMIFYNEYKFCNFEICLNSSFIIFSFVFFHQIFKNFFCYSSFQKYQRKLNTFCFQEKTPQIPTQNTGKKNLRNLCKKRKCRKEKDFFEGEK